MSKYTPKVYTILISRDLKNQNVGPHPLGISRSWRSWLFLAAFILRVTFSKNQKNRQEKLLVSQVNFLAFFFQSGIFSEQKN